MKTEILKQIIQDNKDIDSLLVDLKESPETFNSVFEKSYDEMTLTEKQKNIAKIKRYIKNSVPKKISNPLIKIIFAEMQDRKHSYKFLAEQINIGQRQLYDWFHSKHGSVETFARLMKFYNLDIVKIKKYRVYDQLRSEAKQSKNI